MVRIYQVVTRGGDGGETSLGDGTRVAKNTPRVIAIGDVDEANAAIGVLRVHVTSDAAVDAMLARVQNDLFDLGADLCVPGGDRARLIEAPVARLEAEVAAMNAGLPPLTSFIARSMPARKCATSWSIPRPITCRALRPVESTACIRWPRAPNNAGTNSNSHIPTFLARRCIMAAW